MSKNCVFSICAANYLSQVLVLAESLLIHEPKIKFIIYLLEPDLDGLSLDLPTNTEIRLVSALRDINVDSWGLRYTVIEFSTTIKPFCFKQLWSEGYDKVVYLDPDIVVYRALTSIFSCFVNASIIVTPHFLSIEERYTGGVPLPQILWVGGFNFGFVAIKNNEWGQKIVSWWERRLDESGYADRWDGLHVDQKWMDLLASLVPLSEVHVCRNLSWNVAFWNLHERYLHFVDNCLIVSPREPSLICEEDELLFFHFSGFDYANPDVLHYRHPEWNAKLYPEYRKLFSEYRSALAKWGFEKFSRIPYHWNTTAEGEPIIALNRRLYRKAIEESTYYSSADFIVEMRKAGLMLASKVAPPRRKEIQSASSVRALLLIEFAFRCIHSLIGTRRYFLLIKVMELYARPENHGFLIPSLRAKKKRHWK
jgi:hypothetical protein